MWHPQIRQSGAEWNGSMFTGGSAGLGVSPCLTQWLAESSAVFDREVTKNLYCQTEYSLPFCLGTLLDSAHHLCPSRFCPSAVSLADYLLLLLPFFSALRSLSLIYSQQGLLLSAAYFTESFSSDPSATNTRLLTTPRTSIPRSINS